MDVIRLGIGSRRRRLVWGHPWVTLFCDDFYSDQLGNRPLERLGIGPGQTWEKKGKNNLPRRPLFSPGQGNSGKQLILRISELIFPGLDG